MTLVTELYTTALEQLPKSGKQIIAQQAADEIIVYQAYAPAIADYAVKHQQLGGDHFSYNRMSWIKPNFLWMMFRCGWAEKENQERVLALRIGKDDLKTILREAVHSTFKPKLYESREQWDAALQEQEVRLQWDPDHDPYGRKLERRAIQLGLKGKALKNFGTKYIREIADITAFVKEQKLLLNRGLTDQLIVPVERIWDIEDETLARKIGLSKTRTHE